MSYRENVRKFEKINNMMSGSKKNEKSEKNSAESKKKNTIPKSAAVKKVKPAPQKKTKIVDNAIDDNRGKKREEDTAKNVEKAKRTPSRCPYSKKCGGCQMIDVPYDKQLRQKHAHVKELLEPYTRVAAFIGMEEPEHYRCKVHAVFTHDKKGNPLSGIYKEGTHDVVPVDKCLLEDEKADAIIATIRGMLKSFKIKTYDEDNGFGLLRHVLIRIGKNTGEIMVVLVTVSPVFPSKNNFVKALLKEHPEITTIVMNINDKQTSMILGDKEKPMYGPGFIYDICCGMKFKISPKSFYQVNPVQTEVLYKTAIEMADLKGDETALDCYCGVGTIGIIASPHVKEVISVELNKDAVKDANLNAKINEIKNITFYENDATRFMQQMADSGDKVDLVFMDPPRSGSTPEFISSMIALAPKKVVYISCSPDSLARDLELITKGGYKVNKAIPVDMFPFTRSIETVVLLTK
ncbi:23S rRNA (uracil(1939)-C(5))-methyltransferase RlmD [Butyrivibrio sp. YAB3001]|uniref:23S rRNA (uracil(1939)-C(5))-methyltransferase RlmD n=1 Tax=Butyrivibrio sp. YAB3001 TaxID=1520812 RepID=UPI0008F652F3|nr:23S rRNA (uracil(1939)-C(5))-methyltransferase RlmD [Butyrivibrio sp. YAB3001]SFC93178.1 23S rRNA (uracil1939-C5)-methyltransferase [Butyrivibrio sp. YAB3001]